MINVVAHGNSFHWRVEAVGLAKAAKIPTRYGGDVTPEGENAANGAPTASGDMDRLAGRGGDRTGAAGWSAGSDTPRGRSAATRVIIVSAMVLR